MLREHSNAKQLFPVGGGTCHVNNKLDGCVQQTLMPLNGQSETPAWPARVKDGKRVLSHKARTGELLYDPGSRKSGASTHNPCPTLSHSPSYNETASPSYLKDAEKGHSIFKQIKQA